MTQYKNNKQAVRLPIYIAIAIVMGILIGAQTATTKGSSSARSYNKLRQILTYIENDYVDEVSTEALVDDVIDEFLEKLDPHTNYITAEDNAILRSQLEGNFEGIGIEFNIFKDTIFVIAPLSGGPSIKAGLLAGDKILKVDDEDVAGVGMTNRDVITRLRGEKGSKVNVTIKRNGLKELLVFEIERDVIPQYSVDVSYMIDDRTGYIKVSRFSATTYMEFKDAMGNLLESGMERMVLDLTGNPGGYLDRAVDIVDEFLEDGNLIVYTKGKEPRYNDRHFSKKGGDFENGSLIVMIDEGSASASEIVTGAVQDHDRGIVVGRRSFGKGLVQLPISLDDGSELRLTISRYYTPSGRSIQKPYEDDLEGYHNDFAQRLQRGELFSEDSIQINESLVFTTKSGRKVYGGGGIVPDHFVAADSSLRNSLLNQLFRTNSLAEFSLSYHERHKDELEQYELQRFLQSFEVSPDILEAFQRLAQSNGVAASEAEYSSAENELRIYLKAFIARSMWGDEGFYPVINQTNNIYLRALELFDEADELL